MRGPQVMKGYLNKPTATAQTIDADGWLHTGDIGYADADGHFFIVDRAKELIKYKGFQVPPAELEAVLLTHPCVSDAAVIPCPDDEAGEVPKAILVLKDETTAEDILEATDEMMRAVIEGPQAWRYRGAKPNMYEEEHRAMFANIRSGSPLNNGVYMARSTMLAIMGRMAAYTGKVITWEMALNSKENLGPAQYAWGDAPQQPIPRPGLTQFA